jgi:hypothetical protein
MRSRSVTVRAPRPRNSVVLAIVRRVTRVATRRHRDERRPSRQEAQVDLAQRVRESGEW